MKNRLHLDIEVEELDPAIARVRELGGSVVQPLGTEYGYDFAIMGDPEGNEFCLIRPVDRAGHGATRRLGQTRPTTLRPMSDRSHPTTAAAGGSARRSRSRSSPATRARRSTADTTADVVILGGGYTGHVDRLVPEGARSRRRRAAAGAGHLRRRAERAQRRVRQLLLGRPHDALRAVRRRRGAPPVPRRRGERRPRSAPSATSRGSTPGSGPTATSNAASSTSQIGEWADEVITADRLRLDHLEVLTTEEVRARVDSPVLHGGVFSRLRRHAAPRPARARPPQRAARRRRPDLRAHPRRRGSARATR